MEKKKKNINDIEIWEMQPGESSKAFEAFTIYRDMGAERSIRKTAQKLSKNSTTIKEWSAKFGWVERVSAWDREQDKITQNAQKKAKKEMNERHAKIAIKIQDAALKALDATRVDEYKPSDIAKLIDIATKLERISRGEPTEKVENKTEVTGEIHTKNLDLSKLTDTELMRLEEIVSKLPFE